MDTETIVMCVVALILGMLMANMLKSVCGCKSTVVEGQNCATCKDDFILSDGECSAAPAAPAPPPPPPTGACNYNYDVSYTNCRHTENTRAADQAARASDTQGHPVSPIYIATNTTNCLGSEDKCNLSGTGLSATVSTNYDCIRKNPHWGCVWED